jgi:hypothetical protein
MGQSDAPPVLAVGISVIVEMVLPHLREEVAE